MYHLSTFNCLFRSYNKQLKIDILAHLTTIFVKTVSDREKQISHPEDGTKYGIPFGAIYGTAVR